MASAADAILASDAQRFLARRCVVAATHQNVLIDDATSHFDHAITSIVRRNIPKVSRLLAGNGKFHHYRRAAADNGETTKYRVADF